MHIWWAVRLNVGCLQATEVLSDQAWRRPNIQESWDKEVLAASSIPMGCVLTCFAIGHRIRREGAVGMPRRSRCPRRRL